MIKQEEGRNKKKEEMNPKISLKGIRIEEFLARLKEEDKKFQKELRYNKNHEAYVSIVQYMKTTDNEYLKEQNII